MATVTILKREASKAHTRSVDPASDAIAVAGVVGNDDGNGVVIGAAGSGASTGSALQAASFTTTERDDLVAADGMLVYNTSNSVLQARVNGTWVGLSTSLQYDAYVPDDYATASAAFTAGALSVFVRDGTVTEVADVVIPMNGILVGESPDGAVLDLSGGYSVGVDGSGTDYTTGTVSITNGTTAVTGAGGAAWQTAGIAAGDFILLGVGDKCWWEIASVDSETTLTLVRTYYGQTATAETYEIKSLVAGIAVRDITLKGNTAGAGLSLIHAESAHIDNVHITDCGVGGGTPVAAVLIQDTVDSFFRNLIVLGGPHHGIEIDDSNANTFDSFNVKGFAGQGVLIGGANQDITFNSGHLCQNDLNGFYVTGGSDETLISNCVVSENVLAGLLVDSGTGDTHIRNATLRNNGGNGVTIGDGSGGSVQSCQLSSNSGSGIVATGNEIQINDCMMRGNTVDGAVVSGNNCVVEGCRVSGNVNGINVTGDDTVVGGNRVFGNTTGLLIGSGAADTSLSNNRVSGNTTDYSDSSTSTRWDDQSVGPTQPILNNYQATTDPTTTDDSASGYQVGSKWINTTLGSAWICIDNSASAAIWVATNSLIEVSVGRNSAASTNEWLRDANGTPTNLTPYRIPFASRIVAISASGNASQTWDAEVHTGATARTGGTPSDAAKLTELVMTATNSDDITGLNVALAAGAEIGVFLRGTSIDYPRVTVWLERRS